MLAYTEYSDGSVLREKGSGKSSSWAGVSQDYRWGSRYTKVPAARSAKECLRFPATPLPLKGEVMEKLIVVMDSLQRKTQSIQIILEHAPTLWVPCESPWPISSLRIWNLVHLQKQLAAWAKISSSRGIHIRMGTNQAAQATKCDNPKVVPPLH